MKPLDLSIGMSGVALPSSLIVVAHPDDETIGAAGLLSAFREVNILYVTDGAPVDPIFAQRAGFASREAYRDARRAELACALALCGLDNRNYTFLEVADQGASRNLSSLAWTIAERAREIRPEWILTHSYEGGHPDHDATAFAVHAARRIVGKMGWEFPAIIEFCGYHADGERMAVMEFLHFPLSDEVVRVLPEPARRTKSAMMNCFQTQREMLGQFPTDIERYRYAPTYDFLAPPHGGPLWYERFDWGMTGPWWRALACESLHLLGLESRRAGQS